ncbi:hypothetical protein BCR32DRAFT_325991 [Anaeromyces robustus]|uniref:Uncharacterized protein n=1 Tax=Anaeromyces robustus TaxID=1754192 RepID=A0A1Y1XFZ9_9FUNG|nr:hypothetical protein BCR32DRAFT_325991 [Anaeromyces robustus]|eukprot:ORX84336.1 hypothetical protein BCR32DRAFT_325991 [Anaeromyces robustus]
MGKRTYNNGSHVLKSPPLDPFYIEKDSDYHPNLRHFPDYRRLQYDSLKKEFVPKYFQPIPAQSTYQSDYDVNKNEKEQFKDFKTVNVAKCVKLQNKRDLDVLLKKEKMKDISTKDQYINEEKEEEEEEEEVEMNMNCGCSDMKTLKTPKIRGSRSVTTVLRRPPRKPNPHLTIYDVSYNRLAKVNDLPEIEREVRENMELKKKNKYIDPNNEKFVKLLNKKNNTIYTDESSHFSNVIDESQVFNPFPNFPASFSIYPIFHSAKDDFNTTYRVFHNNRKFSIPEPDIYHIKRKIFEEERELINNFLKKDNKEIKGNVNVNIYNP